jgi:hypothetical protein
MFFDSAPYTQQPALTFTHIDPGFENVKGFRHDLEAYSAFFRHLPGFSFVYASPLTKTFHSAERAFRDIVGAPAHLQPTQAVRYFHARSAWAAKRYEVFTNDDLEFLNNAESTFAGEAFESLYSNWIAGGVTDGQLTLALQSLLGQERRVQFNTYKLPYDYSLLDQNSKISRKPNGKRFSDQLSDRFSEEPSPKLR